MLKKLTQTILALLAISSLAGFSVQKAAPKLSQPINERAAQDALPQSHDQIWATFAKCKVHLNPKDYSYSIDYTPEVKAMGGKQISISGFILPLESNSKFNHFLISKRTPTCPFCPPGEPNEIVEVYTKKPVVWTENLVTVTGTMKFTKDQQIGIFFQLQNADSAVAKK